MKLVKVFLAVFLFFKFISPTLAQDDLDDLLDGMEAEQKTTEKVIATFKGTRVINLQNNEMVAPNSLEFRISHRFGSLKDGYKQFYGLDVATIRLALEYGITNWLMVGWGRSKTGKTIDGFTKVKLLSQTKGKKHIPISLVYFASFALRTLPSPAGRQNYFSSKLAYTHQLIITSKINSGLSVLLSPTLIHQNLVATKADKNDLFALGFGFRQKVTKRMSINAEYIYRIPPSVKTDSYTKFHDSFSVGVDIETGGHVFQLHVSNSAAMFEQGFILQTNQRWFEGLKFGFNISREFAFSKK